MTNFHLVIEAASLATLVLISVQTKKIYRLRAEIKNDILHLTVLMNQFSSHLDPAKEILNQEISKFENIKKLLSEKCTEASLLNEKLSEINENMKLFDGEVSDIVGRNFYSIRTTSKSEHDFVKVLGLEDYKINQR